MGRIEKRIRERRAKNLDELKLFTIEEWNKIPKSFIQKLFKNFIKRCKKFKELNRGRLEPVHLKQIRKEVIDEEKEVKEEKKILKVVNRKIKNKYDFNKNELLQKSKKEITLIRKNSKKKKREIIKNKKEYNKAKTVKIGKKIHAVTDK